MNMNNYFRALEIRYNIEINKNLRKVIEEHLGNDLNIYTEQDLYEQTRKIIQSHKNYK